MVSIIEPEGDGIRLRVKAVPGAARDQIVGVLGDRLKVRVSQAPEGGKANRAICALLASALGVRAKDASVVAGLASAEKVVRVAGINAAAARAALGLNEAEGRDGQA